MKKPIALTALFAIILTSCGKAAVTEDTTAEQTKSVKTQAVTRDFFSEQLKLVGKAAPSMETPITSLVSGTIKKVDAEVGQKVKAGQVLAYLDLNSSTYSTTFNNANNAYNNSLDAYAATQQSITKDLEAASIQLQNAQTAKENTYATTEKQLEIAQTQLDNIRKTASNTQNTTSESLKNAQLMLENARTNLDNFNRNSDENMKGLYESLKVAINSAQVAADSAINQGDIILGVTDKNNYLVKSYEIYLGAKDPSTKKAAIDSFNRANNDYQAFLKKGFGADNASLDTKAVAMQNLLNEDVELFDKIVTMLNNTITSSTLPQAQLDGMNLGASKVQAALLQAQSQITTLKNSISSLKTSINTNSVSLQNAINIANTQLDNIKAGNSSQIDTVSGNETLTRTNYDNAVVTVKTARDNVENALRIAQANYDSIKAKLESQRMQAKTQLDSAKGGKDMAGIQLNNTQIVAPFDGVITGRNIEVGTMAAPGNPAFMIGNDSQMKVKVDVSADNVASLKLGQKAIVKNSTGEYEGIVTLISPAADPVTKMFKAEISFNQKPEKLNLGDFVDVYISKEPGTEKVVLIPFSSVISSGQGEYSVYIVNKDNKIETRNVKLGDQNATQVVILSGLNEGDKVVVSGTLNISEGDKVEEMK